MDHKHDTGGATTVDRRSVLLGGLALTSSLALGASQVWARVARADAASAAGKHAQLLDVISELVIPATQTPSARGVGVPQFVALAIEHGLNGSRPEILDQVQVLLDQRAAGTFLRLAPVNQATTLEILDAEAYAPAATETARDVAGLASWRILKGLILMGYYTSEAGATQELRFQPVPARFDADIPFEPGQPALMNDWYGNAF